MDLSDVLRPSVAQRIAVTVGFLLRGTLENSRFSPYGDAPFESRKIRSDARPFFNCPLAEIRMVYPIENSLPAKMLAGYDRLQALVRILISPAVSDVVGDILCQAAGFGRLT
jgi:hypothetical protein